MKTRTTFLLLFSFLSSSLFADYTVIALSKTKGVLIEHTGPITTKSVDIHQLDETPVVVVPPVKPSDKSAEIAKIVEKINDEPTAKAIYGVFTTIGDFVRSGKITSTEQLEFTITQSFDLILKDQKTATWKPFRDKVNEYYALLYRANPPLTEYADLLDEIASGMQTGQNFDTEAIDFTVIIQIVTILTKGNLTIADFVQLATLVLQLFRK